MWKKQYGVILRDGGSNILVFWSKWVLPLGFLGDALQNSSIMVDTLGYVWIENFEVNAFFFLSFIN